MDKPERGRHGAARTLVLQSHRDPLPYGWIRGCLESVAAWAAARGYDYRFLGDELFDRVDADLRRQIGAQTVIATDLARLGWLQAGLAEGYDCVVWCDADFLVFDADRFRLPGEGFALGREVWIERAAGGRPRVRVKVHNALLMFRRGNAFLDFYADAASRLVRRNRGRMPPQYIGPKLLTALHNLVQCPVMETAAMLPPLVLRDLLDGTAAVLPRFVDASPELPAGVNLCASLAGSSGLDADAMPRLVEALRGLERR